VKRLALRPFSPSRRGSRLSSFPLPCRAVCLYGDLAGTELAADLFIQAQYRGFLLCCGTHTINRYQGIVDTMVQLFVPWTSGFMAFQPPDSFGMRRDRNEGEGT
jgi:hypothetical protein